MPRLYFAFLAALLGVVATVASADYDIKFDFSFKISSYDGTLLKADAFHPVRKSSNPNETFPLIVFPNSWGVPQIEYIVRCADFAKKGYVAVEYETRGWYSSGGEINVAGPEDRADGSAVLSHILKTYGAAWSIDASKVAFAGISYGAGISLMMAAHDPRVKTAVAMSGWNSATDLVIGNNCPNIKMGKVLLDSAKRVGRPSPEIQWLFNNLTTHTNMPWVLNYTQDRSPEPLYLDVYNQKQIPLFISSNYLDRLFRPQYMTSFVEKLKTPFFFLLNQGGHAFPEAIGLVLHDNYIWSKAREWLDHHLKGKDTPIVSEPKVQFQFGDSIASKDYLKFDTWPSPKVSQKVYTLGARGPKQFGTLTAASSSSTRRNAASRQHFKSAKAAAAAAHAESAAVQDSIAFTKSPVLSSDEGHDTMKALGLSLEVDLASAPKNGTVVYVSEPLTDNINICGSPEMSLKFQYSPAHMNGWQIYGFLYEIEASASASASSSSSSAMKKAGFKGLNETFQADMELKHATTVDAYKKARAAARAAMSSGDVIGTYLSDSYVSEYYTAGMPSTAQVKSLKFHNVCRLVKPGSRIAFGVALYNELFLPLQTEGYSVSMMYDAETTISLPVVSL